MSYKAGLTKNVIPLFKQTVSIIYTFGLNKNPEYGHYLDVLNTEYNRTQISLVMEACSEIENSGEFKNLMEKAMAACSLSINKAEKASTSGCHNFTPLAHSLGDEVADTSSVSYFVKMYKNTFFEIQNDVEMVMQGALDQYIRLNTKIDRLRVGPTVEDMVDVLRYTTAGDILRYIDHFNKMLNWSSKATDAVNRRAAVIDCWSAHKLESASFYYGCSFLVKCGFIQSVSIPNALQLPDDESEELYTKIYTLTRMGSILIQELNPFFKIDNKQFDCSTVEELYTKGSNSYRHLKILEEDLKNNHPESYSLLEQLGAYSEINNISADLTPRHSLGRKGREQLIAHGLVVSNPFYVHRLENCYDIILSKKGRDLYNISHNPLYKHRVTTPEEFDTIVSELQSYRDSVDDQTAYPHQHIAIFESVNEIITDALTSEELSLVYKIATSEESKNLNVKDFDSQSMHKALDKLITRGMAEYVESSDGWVGLTKEGLEFFKGTFWKRDNILGLELLREYPTPMMPTTKAPNLNSSLSKAMRKANAELDDDEEEARKIIKEKQALPKVVDPDIEEDEDEDDEDDVPKRQVKRPPTVRR